MENPRPTPQIVGCVGWRFSRVRIIPLPLASLPSLIVCCRSPSVCPVYRAFAPSSLRLGLVVALLFSSLSFSLFLLSRGGGQGARTADYSEATRNLAASRLDVGQSPKLCDFATPDFSPRPLTPPIFFVLTCLAPSSPLSRRCQLLRNYRIRLAACPKSIRETSDVSAVGSWETE